MPSIKEVGWVCQALLLSVTLNIIFAITVISLLLYRNKEKHNDQNS